MVRIFLTTLLFVTMCGSRAGNAIFAQVETENKILKKLEQYCRDVPYEEIFVQTDREDYIAGEDIWLNAYLIDRQSGKPSGQSKILYFELLNPQNFPVIQKLLISENGFFPGQALLPDTLSSGTYTLRAYTNSMKNLELSNCFMKSINVYNSLKDNGFRRKVIYERKLSKKQNIEFFPEGGTLLNEIQGKVAVKVFDDKFNGIFFDGVVRDNTGDSITSFKTNKYGTGDFLLKPKNDKKYYVQVNDFLTFLPDASNEGYTLNVNNLRNDSLFITVTSNVKTILPQKNLYFLLIHNHGIAEYAGSLSFNRNQAKVTIPKAKLSKGITDITLFDETGKPLSERLIYIEDTYLTDFTLIVPDSCERRGRVILDIDIGNAEGKSLIEGNISLSVALKPVDLTSSNIVDYLIFGNEFGLLPWRDKNEMTSDVPPDVIDNFLIGARSNWISWERVLSDNFPSKSWLIEDEGHSLSGIMKSRNKQDTTSGKLLYLSIPGKVAFFQYARTDSDGRFNFVLPIDQTQRILIIQPAIPDPNVTIGIESSFSKQIPLSTSSLDSNSTSIMSGISNLIINYQVGKIYGTTYKKEGSVDFKGSKPFKRFYGKPDVELKMDDYIKLPVVQEIFFELLPGVRLISNKTGYKMRVVDPVNNAFYEEDPIVMIDGVIINDLTVLADFDTELIEKMDVVEAAYMIGDLKLYGIVNVITRAGNFKNFTVPDYAVKMNYMLFDPVVTFNSPDYSDTGSRQSRIPDFRSTLYWNPSLKPDKDGKVSVEFYTSDTKSDYVINVQGITPEGRPISFNRIIKVK